MSTVLPALRPNPPPVLILFALLWLALLVRRRLLEPGDRYAPNLPGDAQTHAA